MAYRFDPDQTAAESLRRCSREQLDRAIQELTDGVKVDAAEAVHTARKALKKERSLLRLGRSALKPTQRRRLNAELRDIGRRLSGARDADVMIEALQTLSDRYAGQVPEPTFAAVRARLESERERLRLGLEASGEIAAAVEKLRAFRPEDWRLRRRGWDAIGPGLRRSYARGRNAMTRAQRQPTVESLHEWRKRVKDLWYHARLLRPVAPQTLRGLIDETHALSDLLGDDHDLALLGQTVSALADEVPADLGPVLTLIAHRRAQLQQEAGFVGARLYAEPPRRFVRRLRRYWRVARAERRALGSRRPVELAQLARHTPTV